MMVLEKKLWNEIKSGNKEIFSEVFVSFYDDIFRYAKRFEKDEDDQLRVMRKK